MLSMGDTPSCSVCENFEGVDEIRPGNFVFYDLMQYNLGVCRLEDIAVRLVCPVLSVHPERNEVAIYGGAIHLSKDFILNDKGQTVYGRIIADPFNEEILLNVENYVCRLSQEHGILRVEPSTPSLLQPGGWVGIIPAHSCLTANLMRGYLTTDGERIGMMNSSI
jgi:D-serine deaminase-like pyridoxal phosphate-dependent protein